MSGPFDPDLARFPTRVVPLERVVDLLQVTHDPQTVGAFQRAMLQGARFPPVSVVLLAGRYIVCDGHKRLTASLRLPANDIVVEVWPLRRLAADLWHQHLRFLRRCLDVTVRAPRSRDALRFGRDTVVHWRRTLQSLTARVRGRS